MIRFSSRNFEREFRCFPMSVFAAVHKRDIDALEYGDKIIMPPSALHILAQLEIMWPMMFKLSNELTGKFVHCGVLEFIAEEGRCYLPSWMMKNLLLSSDEIVKVINATIPKGNHVTFQPKNSEFLKIMNPRAVLERSLRSFTALTKGEVIRVVFNKVQYDLEVTEVGSSHPTVDGGISIIETDVVVDFVEPTDSGRPSQAAVARAPKQGGLFAVYDEQDPDPASSSSDDDGANKEKVKATTYTGSGYSLSNGKVIEAKQPETSARPAKTQAPAAGSDKAGAPVPEAKEDHFANLSGGHRLRK